MEPSSPKMDSSMNRKVSGAAFPDLIDVGRSDREEFLQMQLIQHEQVLQNLHESVIKLQK